MISNKVNAVANLKGVDRTEKVKEGDATMLNIAVYLPGLKLY